MARLGMADGSGFRHTAALYAKLWRRLERNRYRGGRASYSPRWSLSYPPAFITFVKPRRSSAFFAWFDRLPVRQ